MALPAAIMIAPWILRNWIWLGNPSAPFLNQWFPNPYYHAGMEHIYINGLSHYEGIKHNWEIPLQLTLRGGLVTGLFGPAFLLAPFALLSLRKRHGRRLLLAAAVLAIPAYFNTGARFLIPAAPFVALGMGLGLSDSPGVLPAIAIFHAVVSWPSVLTRRQERRSLPSPKIDCPWAMSGWRVTVYLRRPRDKTERLVCMKP